MKKEINSKFIVLTLIGFIILWSIITNAWAYSDYIFLNELSNISSYLYGYISRFIWVIPAIFLIIRYSNNLKFNKNSLFSKTVFNIIKNTFIIGVTKKERKLKTIFALSF